MKTKLKKKKYMGEVRDVWKTSHALYGTAKGFSGDPLMDEELHCAWCHKTVAEIRKTENLDKHLEAHMKPKLTTDRELKEDFDKYWFLSKERTKGSTNAHRYEVWAWLQSALKKIREEERDLIRGEMFYVLEYIGDDTEREAAKNRFKALVGPLLTKPNKGKKV
jgi:hypothetical protein